MELLLISLTCCRGAGLYILLYDMCLASQSVYRLPDSLAMTETCCKFGQLGYGISIMLLTEGQDSSHLCLFTVLSAQYEFLVRLLCNADHTCLNMPY